MALLTITNLRTSPITFQDSTGQTGLVITVPGSGAVTNKSVSLDDLAGIEAQLIAETTASNITWTLSDDPGSAIDTLPEHEVTVLVSPYNAVAGDQDILTDLTTPGAVSVVLSAAAKIGQFVKVIDQKGDANTNNVTITVASAGTINGGANLVINTARGWALLLKTGANAWRGVSSSVISSGAAGGALTGTYPNPTLNYGAKVASDATMAAAGESADHIDVTITLKDLNNVQLASVAEVTVWVSDTSLGAPTGTAPDGGTAVQTGTSLKVDTTAVLLRLLTDATGVAVIRVTESTAKSFWVNVAAGSVTKSQQITFT